MSIEREYPKEEFKLICDELFSSEFGWQKTLANRMRVDKGTMNKWYKGKRGAPYIYGLYLRLLLSSGQNIL